VDVPGAILLAAALVAIVAAISRAGDWGWLAPRTLALAAFGLITLFFFGWFELHRPHPLIDVRTLGVRPVLVNNITTLLIGFGGIGAFVLIPLLAQTPRSTGYGLGVSAASSGFFLLPSAAATIVAAPLAGRWMSRLGPRNVLVVGSLIIGVAVGSLALWHSSPLQLAGIPLLFGFGTGLAYAAIPVLIVETVPQVMTGEATGVNTVLRNVGNALGIQVVTSVLATNLILGSSIPTDRGYALALAIGAATCIAGGLVSLLATSRRGVWVA
jgi:MFS family permease